MARVYPGTEDHRLLRERGFTVNQNQGTPYVTRQRTSVYDVDRRVTGHFQKRVNESIIRAPIEWRKLRPCAQDHYFRATRESRVAETPDGPIFFESTGYKLFLSMFMQTYNKETGKFYSPPCFCLHPVDFIGQKMPVKSRLEFTYDRPVRYVYSQTNRLIETDSCKNVRNNPHRSSGLARDMVNKHFYLSANNCIPRKEGGIFGVIDISKMKGPVMWFPFNFYPLIPSKIFPGRWVPADGGKRIYVWDKGHYIFNKFSGRCDESTGILSVGVQFRFLGRRPSNSMCAGFPVIVQCEYSERGMLLFIIETGKPPYYDFSWGDRRIMRVGMGPGEERVSVIKLTTEWLERNIKITQRLDERLERNPVGRQPYHPPLGRITNFSIIDVHRVPIPHVSDRWLWMTYTLRSSRPVEVRLTGNYFTSTEFMIRMSSVVFDNRGTGWESPYGTMWISGSYDGKDWESFFWAGVPGIKVKSGIMNYCFRLSRSYRFPRIRFLKVTISNALVLGMVRIGFKNPFTGSEVGGASVMEPFVD